LHELSAAEASRRLARREISSEELVRACLERSRERDPDILAWTHLAADSALDEARRRDTQTPLGPLHGIPVAVKDNLDVAAMPATYGSPIYAGHIPKADASCVAMLRAAGAVIIGKTATVEFASVFPAPTRNPHNLAHTPGGSSSGSAAAIADFQVPLAFGSQTGGSVIRPAAFCGVVGFKPSFGRLSTAGCKMHSWTCDTLGFITRSVADGAMMFAASASTDISPTKLGTPEPPRIGLFIDPRRGDADPCAQAAIDAAAAIFASAGAVVAAVKAPAEFDAVRQAQRVIARFELARSLAHEWHQHRDLLSDMIKTEIAEGWGYMHGDYATAQGQARSIRAAMDPLFEDVDVLLTIAASGEAPLGLGSTGSSFFNAPWSLLGNPCICLPLGTGPAGLPTAIQLVGRVNQDERLLHAAAWAEAAIGRV
jgi:Asp-tRNA(Asn)/Glu-tRNA(Gln) amidotransferase A subunit family amidase